MSILQNNSMPQIDTPLKDINTLIEAFLVDEIGRAHV